MKSFPMGHKEKRVYLSSVSGVATTKMENILYFDRYIPSCDIITTKSYQVQPNPGNREPIICSNSAGDYGNSVGLRNPGMDEALKEIKEIREKGIRAWLNISLSASSIEDFLTLIKAFDSYGDSLELNFSCPHAAAGYGASIGSDVKIASEYVRDINRLYPERKSLLFIKLTPNVNNIGEIAKSIVDEGADGIVAINTVGPLLHISPLTNTPILNNPLGGKGGASGKWVHEKAIKAIKEIREAIGDDIPILGMGGVRDAQSAVDLIKAGADSVGIGSALGDTSEENWPDFFSFIKEDANKLLQGEKSVDRAQGLLKKRNTMEYHEYTVKKKEFYSENIALITLSGEMPEFKAGEFVFLWIPLIGEKPFSVAILSPLTFIIKKRGYFTEYLLDNLKEGDKIYLRGPYGKDVKIKESKKALIITGGTGEAVAYPLSLELEKKNIELSYLSGISEEKDKGILEEELKKKGQYTLVPDNGRPGRVLEYLPQEIINLTKDGTSLPDIAFYLIGPEIFMFKASEILRNIGVSDDNILLSMEKNSRCGIGLCGECSVKGRLECQYGTFFPLSFLKKGEI